MKLSGRPAYCAGLVLAGGLLLATAAALWQERWNRTSAEAKFDALSERVELSVANRMRSFEYGLRGARGAVLVRDGQLTRASFQRYSASRDVDREFAGARGFGVIWRVAPADEATFVAGARRDGWPAFSLRQLEPHEGERYVIQYIEPVERNRAAVGLDIASERNRREAAVAAARTGLATLTEPITLVQATGKPARSFLLLLPIYRPGSLLSSAPERQSAVMGWSYAPLIIDEVLANLDSEAGKYTLALRDAKAADGRAFYTSASTDDAFASQLRRQAKFEIFGRTWEADFRATPAFVAELNQTSPLHTGAVVAVIGALCALLAALLTQAAARRAAGQMEQARRASIIQSSDDAIVGVALDGSVTDWNAGAQRLFGFNFLQALGGDLSDLLVPPTLLAEEIGIRDTVQRSERVAPFETARLDASGELIDVSISAAPITSPDGRCVGYSMTMRDIRDAKRARQALADLNASLESQVAERTERLDLALHDLRSILDAVPSQIGYWDAGLRNQIANRAYHTWFGVEPENLRGRHMSELLGDALFERSRPRLEAALNGQAQSFYEHEIPTPDGLARRHAHVSYLPDFVDGQVRGVYTLVHDITDGVEARRELAAAQRESEALLRTLHLHAIVSVADHRGRITDVNDSFCAISGYSREELLDQDHRILNSGHHARAFWIDMWRTISSGQAWRGEVCNRAKDGTLYWVNSLVAPFIGADGRIEKYISIRYDITPIKRAQAQSERSQREAEAAERFLRAVTDKLPLRIAHIDDSLRFRFVNASMCGYFRKSREQILGRTWDELTGAPPTETVLRQVDAVLAGKSTEFVAHEEDRTFETRLVPDRDDGGRVAGFFAVSADITERQQSETELRRTLTLLKSVLEASTQASIIAVEPDGKISIFNRGAQQLLGYAANEVVGRETSLKFHDPEEMRQRAAVLTRELGRKVHTGRALIEPEALNQTHEWTYIRSDGARIPVSLAVTAMHDDHGILVGYLGVAQDISTRIQHEITLRHALQKAKAANQAKSQFLANMSHEIRTPMNAVIGLAYLLERTKLDTEQADTLGKIKLAGQSLLGIINDVLDLSKIEASEMHLEQAPFLLGGLLDDVASLARLQAEAKGVGFDVQSWDALPQAVLGDATRLRQVLINLLSNAVKFTERGSVRLGVQALQSPAGRVRLRFEIKDSGVGIAPEVLPKLFAPFVQADTSTTRRFGGTGLGLSIVRQLVTLMGGEVGVTSTPRVGSEFWVELEFPVCDEAAVAGLAQVTAPSTGPGLTGVRVLVADDSPINLEVARRILELEGAHVWLANNGQEAVDYLLTIPQAVDVVLMDVQMPVLDGHDATRRIRSGLGLKDLPIIALTAGITTGEHERSRAAGMNDVVSKPFEPPALVRCIRKHVQVSEPVHEPAQAASVQQVGAAPHWPQIEGIDARDARTRLGGDVALFRSLLRRLLEDFADLGNDRQGNDLAALAARLHNLKGSAGTLGAKAVERLAGQAEQACRAGLPQELEGLMPELAGALAGLRAASAAVLQAPDEEEPDQAVAGSLDGPALAALLEQLRRFDMAAMDSFKALAPQLRPRLGPQAFATVRQQLDDLQFEPAIAALQGIENG